MTTSAGLTAMVEILVLEADSEGPATLFEGEVSVIILGGKEGGVLE